MGGACAAVYHEQKWLNVDDVHNFDYKIMVEPWTPFAQVTVTLHGVGMHVDAIYGAHAASRFSFNGWQSKFTVSLDAIGGAGCDHCFEIAGTGQPSASPSLSCKGLVEVRVQPSRLW